MRVTLWPTGETVRTPAAEDAGNTAKWHELVAVSYTDRADADKGTTPILRVEVIEDGLTTTLIGMLEIPVLPFVLNEGHLMKSWYGGQRVCVCVEGGLTLSMGVGFTGTHLSTPRRAAMQGSSKWRSTSWQRLGHWLARPTLTSWSQR